MVFIKYEYFYQFVYIKFFKRIVNSINNDENEMSINIDWKNKTYLKLKFSEFYFYKITLEKFQSILNGKNLYYYY